ncbi:Amidinotransferase [Tenacibaculum sp. 190524A02b]|uniref:Amidinotransferase n=1 Tax=Tenacibaculum vairaonense TaxID=3137860 RepID=A0ABP1FCK9_9FLAO
MFKITKVKQTTNTILMVRPASFRMNEQTAVNNYYQQNLGTMLPASINAKAQEEFDVFVGKLRAAGVVVIVVEDTKEPDTPDALFPNNWISFHENGDVAVYPMFAENRRLERREDVLEILEEKGFVIENVVDYSEAEEEEVYLEGTGSMILDRANRKAYCALSPRADEELFIEFCEDFEYTPVVFTANQTVANAREAIYHTNVMMCVAETFAVVCLDAIDDKKEKKNLIKHLKSDGKEVIAITENQVVQFAGNMLQVVGEHEERYLVMSASAYNSLTVSQLKAIEKHCEIIHSSLETIETCGGGSARCMMAEVFLPKN